MRDAIVAQTAAALASGEFAEQHCPNIRVDHKLIAEKAKQAGVSTATFKSDESYEEQRKALASVQAEYGVEMVCMVLPSSHGGIARGIISKR